MKIMSSSKCAMTNIVSAGTSSGPTGGPDRLSPHPRAARSAIAAARMGGHPSRNRVAFVRDSRARADEALSRPPPPARVRHGAEGPLGLAPPDERRGPGRWPRPVPPPAGVPVEHHARHGPEVAAHLGPA